MKFLRMKNSITLLLVTFSFFSVAQVHQPNLLSLKVIGGNGGDQVHTQVIGTIDGGFIISLGSTSTTGSIDSFCSVTYGRTIFQKYNADASVLEWSKCYYSNFNDSGFINIFPVADGGYVLGGGGNGATHKFLIRKENAAGIGVWSKSYGDGSEILIRSMTATDDGGYVMFANFYYPSIDFPVHYGGFGNLNLAVIKVDSNGNKLWCKTIGGTGIETANCVIAASIGGCYIVGTTSSNDYDCIGNHGGADIYLARLDGSGNILWHHDLGGSGGDNGAYGYPDGKGGIIVAGSTNSDDGEVSNHINTGGGNNIWVVNVDSSNHIVWDNCYGGASVEFPVSVCKGTDGSVWVAGRSRDKGGQVDTGYGGSLDAWFVHADSVGNFINAKVMGSSGQDVGQMVYPLSNGNVIAGGYYEKGDGVFPNGSSMPAEAFIAVFAPSTVGITNITFDNSLRIHPNPAQEYVDIQYSKESSTNCEIIICNIFGKKIYHNTLINIDNTFRVVTNGWSAGVYFVYVMGKNGDKEVGKLIIK